MELVKITSKSRFYMHAGGALVEVVPNGDEFKTFVYYPAQQGKYCRVMETDITGKSIEVYLDMFPYPSPLKSNQQMLPGFTPWDMLEGLANHD